MHTCVHFTTSFLMWIFFVTAKSVGAILFLLVDIDVSVTCGWVSEGKNVCCYTESECISVRETQKWMNFYEIQLRFQPTFGACFNKISWAFWTLWFRWCLKCRISVIDRIILWLCIKKILQYCWCVCVCVCVCVVSWGKIVFIVPLQL